MAELLPQRVAPRNTVSVGDARARLRELPAACVDTVITSPPYFRLRDYGAAEQHGREEHVEAWVEGLRAVCRELHRVLAAHGSLWLNVGDTYSDRSTVGAPVKSLLLGPERLAQALVADGWLLRNKVVWEKPNPLPSSATDRLTPCHEYIYLLVKQPRYFFDLDAIREPFVSSRQPATGVWASSATSGATLGSGDDGLRALARAGRSGHPLGKNPGDVWRFGSSVYRGAHFATFPPQLVRRPLLAGCPLRVCVGCGQPWHRSTRRVLVVAGGPAPRPFVPCGCQAPTRPGLVLDPFFGAGTVAVVAERHYRDWLGIELNPAYVALASARLRAVLRKPSNGVAPIGKRLVT